MRKPLVGLVIRLIVLLFNSAVISQEISNNKTTFEYSISISEDDIRVVDVEAKLVLNNGKLMMAPWGYPSSLKYGWANFVKKLQVIKDGNTLDYAKREGGVWLVDYPDGTDLILKYQVALQHDKQNWDGGGGNDSRPAIASDSLFYVTKALFIISDDEKADAIVDFSLPQGWKVSSPWVETHRGRNQWYVQDLTELINNSLVLGKHIERKVENGNMTVIIAIDRALKYDHSYFSNILALQLESYRKIFGVTPKGRYLIAIRHDLENDGEAFSNSFNQTFNYTDLASRKIIWSNTFAHELFHYWNGAGRLKGKDYRLTEWFSEGFTEYYASLTLMRNGIIPLKLWFKKLEIYMSRFFISRNMFPGKPVSLHNSGKDKINNWLLIYGGGATFALMLDIEIRYHTDGKESLDSVMRTMDIEFGKTGIAYSYEDVLTIVNKVSDNDFTAFFQEYIQGTETLPDFKNTLLKIGLQLDNFVDEYYVKKIEEPTRNQRMLLEGFLSN